MKFEDLYGDYEERRKQVNQELRKLYNVPEPKPLQVPVQKPAPQVPSGVVNAVLQTSLAALKQAPKTISSPAYELHQAQLRAGKSPQELEAIAKKYDPAIQTSIEKEKALETPMDRALKMVAADNQQQAAQKTALLNGEKLTAESTPKSENQSALPFFKDAANPILYTGMQLGAGVASTPFNVSSGAATMATDALTGGRASDDYKKLDEYYRKNPEMLGKGQTKLGAITGQAGINDFKIAQQAGVSVDSLKLYRNAGLNERVAAIINDEVGATTPDWFKSSFGQAVYSIGAQAIPMMYTMGAGASTSGEGFIESLMNKAKPSRALVNLVKPNSTTLLMGASSAGGKYNQLATEYGANPVNAVNAIATGYLEALTENIGGYTNAQSYVKKFSRDSFRNNVVKYLVSAAEEGLEEVINVPLEGLTDKLTVDPNRAWAGKGGVFDLERMLDAGVQGSLVGALMGGPAFINATTQHVVGTRTPKSVQEGVETITGIAKTSLPENMRPAPVSANTATMSDYLDYQKRVKSAIEGLRAQLLARGKLSGAETVDASSSVTGAITTTNQTSKIRQLATATTQQLKSFVQNALSKSNTNQYLKVAEVSPRLVTDLKSVGISVENGSHALRDNDIRHIDIRHGSQSNDKYKVTEEDYDHVPDIVQNYDNLYLGYLTKQGNQTIVYEKTIGNKVYYVEEILQDSVLATKQMIKTGINSNPSFMKKIKKVSSTFDTDVAVNRTTSVSSPGKHVQDAKVTADNTSIPTSSEKSNKKYRKIAMPNGMIWVDENNQYVGLVETQENGKTISWLESPKDSVSNPAAAFEEKWGIQTKTAKPSKPTEVSAFLKDGTIVLNTDKVDTYSGAVSKIAHEATHVIERTAYWDELKKAAGAYYKAVDPRLKISDMREAVKERYRGVTELSSQDAVAEVVAGFVEDICATNHLVGERASRILIEKSPNGFKRMVQFLKDKVNNIKNMTPLVSSLSRQQRQEYAAAMQGLKNLKKGLEAYRKGNIDKNQSDVRYSIDKPFSQAIDEIAGHEQGKTYVTSHVYMGQTPKVLIDLGLKRLPMLITSKHIGTIMNESGPDPKANYHGLGKELVKQIPAALENPVMVMMSNTKPEQSIVVLTTLRDSEGRPIISAIKFNGSARYNNVQISSNIVTSTYGRNKINNYIDKAVRENRVLYFDKQKSQQLKTPGVQFPDNLTTASNFEGQLLIQSPEVQFPDELYSADFSSNIARFQSYVNRAGTNNSIRQTKNNDTSYSYGEGSFTEYYLEYKGRQYGTIPKGENAYREVSVPKQTSDKTKTRRTVRTILEAESTPDMMLEPLKKDIMNEAYAYVPVGDKVAQREAEQTIERRGWVGAMEYWKSVVNGDEPVTKYTLALGEKLLVEVGRTGNVKLFQKLAAEVSAEATRAGQIVQAVRLIKKMTPEGQLYYIQKSVDAQQKTLNKKFKNKAPDLEIDPELGKKLLEAKTTEETETASMEIMKSIAEQIPSTWQDKWDAWRYLAMLVNPRTHIRNVLGNTVFVPVRAMKNVVVMGAERTRVREHRLVKPEDRTAEILTKKDRPLVEFARQDFEEMKEILVNGGKMNPSSQINELRPIFTSKAFAWLEWIRKFNNRALEAEDLWVLRPAYVKSMARAIKARNLDVAFLNNGTREAKIQYRNIQSLAAKEALEATYRDASAVASAMNRIKNTNAATQIIGGGLMAFTKTPVNVLKRGVEYSPAGLIKSAIDFTYGIKSGKKTVSDAVGSLCKGTSGVGIALLGYWLSSLGILVAGGPDDNKERGFETLQGTKFYSLKIGDVYYTLDWMAPVALPLFVGAELHQTVEGEGFDFATIVDSITKISEPMFNLSMLDGINSAFKSIAYSNGNYLTDFAVQAATSYITQAFPTLGGQIARTIDGTQRNSYYIDKTSPVPENVQKFLNAVQAKIPGLSFMLEPKVDQWGRQSDEKPPVLRAFENFISPGYSSTAKVTDVDEEIKKIYEATGEASVLPSTAKKNMMVDGETYKFEPKEYTEYAKERGQKAFTYINQLLGNSEYQKLSVDEKVEVVSWMYQYANAEAKHEVNSDYDIPQTVIKAYEAYNQANILYGQYYLWKMNLGDSPNQQEVIDALNKSSLTRVQKGYLFAQKFPKSKRKPFK